MFPTVGLSFLNHIVELWFKLMNILLSRCYSNGLNFLFWLWSVNHGTWILSGGGYTCGQSEFIKKVIREFTSSPVVWNYFIVFFFLEWRVPFKQKVHLSKYMLVLLLPIWQLWHMNISQEIWRVFRFVFFSPQAAQSPERAADEILNKCS